MPAAHVAAERQAKDSCRRSGASERSGLRERCTSLQVNMVRDVWGRRFVRRGSMSVSKAATRGFACVISACLLPPRMHMRPILHRTR